MLARLASGIALASVAALLLAGCTPPEPTEDELIAEITATTGSFFDTVGAQLESGTSSATDLSLYATADLSERWAADVQAVIDSGTSSRGSVAVTHVELSDRDADGVSATICTDDRAVTTTNADGSSPEPNGLVAWETRLVHDADSSRLLLDTLAPIVDESTCGA